MALCMATFNGARELSKVEDFTTRAELYRHVEHTSNVDALTKLSLLLTGEAQT